MAKDFLSDLNLTVRLLLSGNPGAAGEQLTSRGAGLSPIWKSAFDPGFAANQWYGPPLTAAPTQTVQVASQMLAFGWGTYIASARDFRIGVRTGSTFAGSITLQLCIFDCVNMRPANLIFNSGSITATAASTNYVSAASVTLQPGFYFLGHLPIGTISSSNVFLGTTSSTRTFGASMNEYTTSLTLVNQLNVNAQTSIPSTISAASLGATASSCIITFLIPL